METALFSGAKISPYYDSMIAKLIVHANNRLEAIKKMNTALEEFELIGLPSNIEFLKKVMGNEKYIKGMVDTSFVGELIETQNK